VADAPLAAAADTASAAGPAGAADPEAIASWLTELGIEQSRPHTLSRTGLGQSNLTYAVDDRAGRRWILRRPPLGRLLASAHDVAREARIRHALRDTDVAVPRVLGAKTDTVLMELVDGMVLDQPGTVLWQALPAQRKVTLVHGDFHLRNLIVSGDDAGTIRSVLEWQLCTLGDPLAGVLRRALDEPRNRAGVLMPSADQIEALITQPATSRPDQVSDTP
jgi:aminoglycoside phosphotransferase (APT) family kinase protein